MSLWWARASPASPASPLPCCFNAAVAVVEGTRFGHSVTTHSTVKVTVGHGTLYSEIERKRGFDAAAAYAEANVASFHQVLELVRTLEIECGLEHGHPHVIYTDEPDKVEEVEREADVAGRIGLPADLVSLVGQSRRGRRKVG